MSADDRMVEEVLQDLRTRDAVSEALRLNPSDQFDKRTLASKLVGELTKVTKGLFRDEYWHGINNAWKALDASGIDWHRTGSEYGPKGEFPHKFKRFSFEVNFTNKRGKKETLYGTVTAHGAGSVDDPLEKYDITVQLS